MDISVLLLTLGPAVLLLAIGLWLLWPSLCRSRREKALLRMLHNLGPDIRRDVVLEDGMDGLTFMHFVVLTPDGAVAVEYLPLRGAIFGAENADQWSQVVGHRTKRFPNPLTRVDEQVATLRLNAPDLKPRGLVLFGRDCTFPKGRPEGVVVPGDIETDRPPTAAPATLSRAWRDFVDLTERKATSYWKERELMREKPGRVRPLLGTLCTAAALAWAFGVMGILAPHLLG